jgi:4-carboxymuconolactone decarboxylase
MPDSDSPRLAPTTAAEWDDQTAALMASVGELNIFATLAHHPKLLKRWLVFGGHVLGKSTLPARERELVILRTGFLCKSGYEWTQHVLIGKREGLTDDEIARIKKGAPAGWGPADAALIRASDELHIDQFITNATWEALSKHFNQKQCMDVVYTAGQYTQVSMMLNSFGVQLDSGLTLDPDLKHY